MSDVGKLRGLGCLLVDYSRITLLLLLLLLSILLYISEHSSDKKQEKHKEWKMGWSVCVCVCVCVKSICLFGVEDHRIKEIELSLTLLQK